MITRDKKTVNSNGFVKRMALLILASAGIIAGLYNGAVSLVVFVILALYIVSTYQIQNAYEVLFFLLPFANVFKVTYGTPSLVTALQLVLLFRIIIVSRTIVANKIASSLGIVFILYCAAITTDAIISVLLFAINIVFLLCSTGQRVADQLNARRLIVAFSIGLIVSAVYGALKEHIAPLSMYIIDTLYRLEDNTSLDRLSGLNANPNYFSIEISMAMAALFCLYMHRGVGWKAFYTLEIALLVLGLMSQSSSFMITLIVFAICVGFTMIRIKQKELMRLMVAIIILCVLCAPALQQTILPYMSRFIDKISVLSEGGNIDEFTTNRTYIWNAYYQEIISSPSSLLFGHGLEAIIVINGSPHAAHNAFVQLVYCMGLIGSIIYLLFFVTVIYNNVSRGNGAYYLILLLILIARGMSANISFDDNLFYYVLLLCLLRYMSNNKRPLIQYESAGKAVNLTIGYL